MPPATAQLAEQEQLVAVLREYRTEMGRSLLEVVDQSPVLLIFLRHFGCAFCRQALDQVAQIRDQVAARGAQPVFVHLGSPERAKPYFDYYQLSTVEVPNSAAGKHLGQLVSTVTLWATSDALSAIEEIQTLSSDPTTAAGRRRLAHDELLPGRDRAQAQSQLSAADQILRARLPALHLTTVPTSRS